MLQKKSATSKSRGVYISKAFCNQTSGVVAPSQMTKDVDWNMECFRKFDDSQIRARCSPIRARRCYCFEVSLAIQMMKGASIS